MRYKKRMSEKGRRVLTELEGVEYKMYKDVAGYPTIGVGHLLNRDELTSGKIWVRGSNGQRYPIRWTDGITEEQAQEILADDLVFFADRVWKYAGRQLTIMMEQHEFDALVSFTFNVGHMAFANSTLAKRIINGPRDDVPNQFRRWVYAGGKKIKGLANRREREIAMWLGDYKLDS